MNEALQALVNRSISQVTRHASSRAYVETKVNAFRLLTMLGLWMLEWTGQYEWHKETFNEASADALTDAMRTICHWLGKDGRTKMFSDQVLLDDLQELDKRREYIQDSVLGLDAVLSVVHKTDKSAITNPPEASDVIDLTDD